MNASRKGESYGLLTEKTEGQENTLKNRLTRGVRFLTHSWEWRPFARLRLFVRDLPRGDQTILGLLVLALVITSIVSLRAFELSFLVNVPTEGGTLVEGELGSPRYVNPVLALSDADRDITALTYAGLMGLSPSGKLVPVLAQSYTVSPDGRVYTFTIRPTARFSDGTPVTAEDVVFTIKKIQDPGIKSPQFPNWNGVSVTAVNSHTVRFTLTKPYAPFLENATIGILPAHLWRNVSDAQFPFVSLETNPVGAGPFVVRRVVRANNGIITEYDLAASPTYVEGRPYLNGITVKFYSHQTDLVAALKSGAIQSAYNVPLKEARIITAPLLEVFGVFFNANQNTVLAQKAVREALSVAIDRKNIVNTVLGGYATAIAGPLPAGTEVTQAPVPPSTGTIQNAARILEQAGWTYDGSTQAWKNKKEKLTLSSLTIKTSNAPQLKAVASAIRNNWQKLGIATSIELYEPGDLNQNVIRPRKYGALLFGMVVSHSQDLYAFWHSSERVDPGLNIALYANKSVDNLLEDARTTTDPQKRLKDLNALEKIISADYPAAFLYTPRFTYVIPPSLKGVALPPIATPSDRFASVASWYEETNAVWPLFAPYVQR